MSELTPNAEDSAFGVRPTLSDEFAEGLVGQVQSERGQSHSEIIDLDQASAEQAAKLSRKPVPGIVVRAE